MSYHSWLTAGSAIVLLSAGCNGPSGFAWRERISPPHLFRRETLEYQRSEAQQFDPYPQDELGPEIEGGRPPDFQKPPPDAARGRWLRVPWSAAPPSVAPL